MTTVHVQTKDAQSASGTTLAVNLTSVGAGNHFAASTIIGGTSVLTSDPLVPTSTPSATWSNAIAAFTIGTTPAAGRMDYSESVASGSWTVNIRSNTTKEITGIVSESSGVLTTLSLGAINHATGNGVASLAPGSITPAAGSIVYTSAFDDGGLTTADTIGSSYAISSDATAWNGVNQRGGQAHLDNVAASATNPTWSLPSGTNNMGAMIAEFKAATTTGLPPGLGPAEHMQPAMTMPIGW